MSDVDDQIARARAAMERIGAQYRGGDPDAARRRRRVYREGGRRAWRILVANAALFALAIVIGFVSPIGIFGFLLTIALMMLVTVALAVWPTERAPSLERVVKSDIKALPAQTGRWLSAQRPQLPAPAVQLVDRIGRRLEVLTPQLARVDDDAPEAGEVRKLVGEQLPAFLNDYARVPSTLRGEARNGRTPDMELVDGLQLIEREIGEMTQRLAAGDLDQLQTRGRYLELKYRDERAGGSAPG